MCVCVCERERERESAMSVQRFIDGRTYRNIGLHCIGKWWKANIKSMFSITFDVVRPHTQGSSCDQQVQPNIGGVDLVNRDL